MAAVITDVPNRWTDTGRPRHLTVLPPPAAGRPRVAPAVYRRRRRALATVVVVALFLVVWAALEVVAGALGVSEVPVPTPTPTSPAPAVVEVAPGDTFWSIASRLDPRGDPRPIVDRLVAAHGGQPLQAGEHLVVPRS